MLQGECKVLVYEALVRGYELLLGYILSDAIVNEKSWSETRASRFIIISVLLLTRKRLKNIKDNMCSKLTAG